MNDIRFKYCHPVNSLGHALSNYRLLKKYVDTTIKVGNQCFDAHKLVLELVCPEMDKRVTSGFFRLTNYECQLDENMIQPEIVNDLLNFLYTSEIELTPKSVFHIFKAARYLNLESLQIGCEKFLSEFLVIPKTFEMFAFARKHNLKMLEDACMEQLVIFGEAYDKSDMTHIRELSLQDIQLMIRKTVNILNTNVSSIKIYDDDHKKLFMRKLFETVVYWIDCGIIFREECLQSLLEMIPNLEIDQSDLEKVCDGILEDMRKKYGIYCFGAGTVSHKSDSHGPWVDMTYEHLIPANQGYMCGAVHGKKIYLFGGMIEEPYNRNEHKSKEVNTTMMYDTETKEFRLKEPMPEGRYDSAAAALGKHIYVAGGWVHGVGKALYDLTSSVLRYDTETGQWSAVKPMHEKRCDFSLIAHKGLLYAVGGHDGPLCSRNGSLQFLTTVEIYDPETDQWSLRTKGLGYGHWAFRAAVHHDGWLYLCGDRVFERYSLEEDVLERLNEFIPFEIIKTRYGSGFVSFDQKLWTVGGCVRELSWLPSSAPLEKNVYSYDDCIGMWTKGEDMNIGRRFHCILAIDYT